MSLELTAVAKQLLDQTNIQTQLVLQIEGIPFIFGAVTVQTNAKYGEAGVLYGNPGLYYGGLVDLETSKDWLSLKGTTKSISQQLLQDKGGSQSISNVKVELINRNGELDEIFSEGFYIDDLLSARAELYLAFQGGSWPEDAVLIFAGAIDNFLKKSGSYTMSISTTEYLRRQEVYVKYDNELDGGINDSVTTLTTVSTQGLLLPIDVLKTYVRINDEIIEYTGISGNDLTGLTRGALNTFATSHSSGDGVESFYRLQGTPIDLALKLSLSAGPDAYATEVEVARFQVEIGVTSIPNAIFFIANAKKLYNISVGDTISTTGATNPSNNVTDRVITQIVDGEFGFYVIVDGAEMVDEPTTTAKASFKSQYNVLSDGLGLKPNEIDIDEHIRLDNLFGSSFPPLDIYIKDSISGKDFIQNEILYPFGFYSVVRKAKVSLAFTAPPLTGAESPTLNESNIKNIERIQLQRTFNKNFYNSIIYKYNESALNNRTLLSDVFISEDSNNRIRRGNAPLTITAKGFRGDGTTKNFISLQATRFLDRYKFGALFIRGVKVLYSVGATVELADVVTYAPEGETARLMEVVNKSMDITTGDISLDLLDTAFALDGRFTVVGPSSKTTSGATLTNVPLQKIQTTPTLEEENFKWGDFIGETIQFRSSDFTTVITGILEGFRSDQPNTMIVSSMTGVPTSDMWVESIPYDDASVENQELPKKIYAYLCPQVAIVSGTSGTVFDVAPGDIDKFFIGSKVRVHNDNFTVDSVETSIIDITSNTITVAADLGFTPTSSEVIDLIGFKDLGLPYRYI